MLNAISLVSYNSSGSQLLFDVLYVKMHHINQNVNIRLILAEIHPCLSLIRGSNIQYIHLFDMRHGITLAV